MNKFSMLVVFKKLALIIRIELIRVKNRLFIIILYSDIVTRNHTLAYIV